MIYSLAEDVDIPTQNEILSNSDIYEEIPIRSKTQPVSDVDRSSSPVYAVVKKNAKNK